MQLNLASSIEPFVQKYLRIPVFYVVPDPNWALGLEEILPWYAVVCADDSPTVDYLQGKGIPVFCVQRDLPELFFDFKRSSSSLLRLPEVQDFIRETSRGEQPRIMVFKTSPALEKAAEDLGYHLLAVDSRLNRRFEDKISILSELEILGQGAIPSLIGRVSDLSYAHLNKSLGDRFVIQFSRGFAGNSTVFIASEDEFREFARHHQERRIKCSKLIRGQSLTIDACVASGGTLFSHYFYQIIGEQEYNRFAGGTSGNDYAYDFRFSPAVDEHIRSLVTAMGEYMKKQGYRGIFGLDMIVDNETEQVYIIEDNARLVASIPVFTRLQTLDSEVPMALIHLLEHLRIPYELGAEAYNEQLWHRRQASQLILRNTEEDDIFFSSCPQSGIYSRGGAFKRSGCSLQEAAAADEFVLLASSPGRSIGSNIEYAQVQRPCGIIGSDRTMSTETRALVQRVKDMFQRKAAVL